MWWRKKKPDSVGGDDSAQETESLFPRGQPYQQGPPELDLIRAKSSSLGPGYGAVEGPFQPYDTASAVPSRRRPMTSRDSEDEFDFGSPRSLLTGVGGGGLGGGIARTTSSGSQHHPHHYLKNNGTALESLSSRGIWALLLIPYAVLAVALAIDLDPNLRTTSTLAFDGSMPLCNATSSASTSSPSKHHQHHHTACVREVNENFTAVYSGPFKVPLQSSFLNLDASFMLDTSSPPSAADDPAIAAATNDTKAADSNNSTSTLPVKQDDVTATATAAATPPANRIRRRFLINHLLRATNAQSTTTDDTPDDGDAAEVGGDSSISSTTSSDDSSSTGTTSDTGDSSSTTTGNDAEEDGEGTVLAISAKLEVPLPDQGGWRVLYQGPTFQDVMKKQCNDPTQPTKCMGFRLLAVLFDTPGVDRGFSQYRVAVTIEGPGAAYMAHHLSFDVHSDRATYLWVSSLLRAVLLTMTIMGAYLWYTMIREEKPEICSWLPEQQHVAVLFPALLLWQNPLDLALAFVLKPRPLLLFLSDLSHACGYQTMLLAWLCIIDGLRRYETPREAWLRAIGKKGGGKYVQHRTPASASIDTWPPKHHPLGEYFSDFIVPKLGLYMLAIFTVVVLCGLRYPQLILATDPTPYLPLLRKLYTIVSLATLGVMLLWYLAFARAVVKTARALRRQPYMKNRSQQLSYRFVAQQVFLVLVCKGVALTFVVLRVGQLLRSHITHIYALWRAELAIDSAQLPFWASSFRTHLGELLFVSVTCYLTSFIFLPAKRWSESDVGGGGYPHVSLESELPEELQRGTGLGGTPRPRPKKRKNARPVFCLETACWLMEAAWQAYYDPDGHFHTTTDDAVTPGKMALGNLGLEMEAYICDQGTDTHAIFARGRGCLVLAFRGTLSQKNMLTDLNMNQLPLPDLAMRKKPYVIKAWDNNGGALTLDGSATPRTGGSRRGSSSRSDRLSTSQQKKTYASPLVLEEEEKEKAAAVGRFRTSGSSSGGGDGGQGGRGTTEAGGGGGGGSIFTPSSTGDLRRLEGETNHTSSTNSLDGLVASSSGGERGKLRVTTTPDRFITAPGGRMGRRRGRSGDSCGSPSDLKAQMLMGHNHGTSKGGGTATTPTAAAEDRYRRRSSMSVTPPLMPASPIAINWRGPSEFPSSPPPIGVLGGRGRSSSGGGGGGEGMSPVGGGRVFFGSSRYDEEKGLIIPPPPPKTTMRASSDEGPSRGASSGLFFHPPSHAHRKESSLLEGSNNNNNNISINGSGASSITTTTTTGADLTHPNEKNKGSLCFACRKCLANLPALRHTLPHVHAGFWAAYLSVRSEVFAAVKSALSCRYAPLFFTGHSLGGALAQLAAYDISVNFDLPDPIQVYTQGSPRVGNLAFSSLYESKVPATFRVVVDGDIIPGMPKMFGMYKHGGIEVLVDADNGGNIIVKPSVVEGVLRMRNRTSTVNHSLCTYRDCMEACFDPEDLVLYLPKVLGQENRKSADEDLPEWLVGSRRSTLLI